MIMSDVAIRVEGLGKQYKIGRLQKRNDTLRDAIVGTFKRRDGERSNVERDSEEFIWALRDVSFEVKRGDVVGIIGRNGAGKSTLLKILSRITEPTTGMVDIYGRVGSLLEVGTGFHPELTGRENIFLNGAILGMRRADIIRKFDEIVAFAEVEKFIDTPVKRYSSGMYVRLAFAVAAHLEPEILVVDEVLAVGDAAFQKKCLGKMSDVAHEGRTVLFVSHNSDAISMLTTTAYLLELGRLFFAGETSRALAAYRGLLSINGSNEYRSIKRTGIVSSRVITSEENNIHRFGETLVFEFGLSFTEKPGSIQFAFQVVDEKLRPVINPRVVDTTHEWSEAGTIVIRCTLPKSRIYQGRYSLTAFLGDRSSEEHFDSIQGVCEFEVVMDGFVSELKWLPQTCAYIEEVEWSVGRGDSLRRPEPS